MSDFSLSFADKCIINLDRGLRTVFGRPPATDRPVPGQELPVPDLSEAERRQSEGLMRVNHTGEVCAQALYQGQAMTARSRRVETRMQRAADEENDHLVWCEERLRELHGHTSYLNPFWYLASVGIGMVAGAAGDKWSLGFVSETEHQVCKHLDEHLHKLSAADQKSRAILEVMKVDEMRHADMAIEAGAAQLPRPVKRLMSLQSKLMTRTAYWV
jgi:ubiquinone biosynthesis monooxygenase Coq7